MHFRNPPSGSPHFSKSFIWEIHQQKVSGSPSSYLLLLLLEGKVPTPRNKAICFACMHVHYSHHHLLHHPSSQNQLLPISRAKLIGRLAPSHFFSLKLNLALQRRLTGSYLELAPEGFCSNRPSFLNNLYSFSSFPIL